MALAILILAACPGPQETAPEPLGAAPVPPPAALPPSPTATEESRVFTLERGEMLRFEVEQQGLDLALVLEDPAGLRRIEIDSPNGGHGIEWIDWIAEESGTHRVIWRRLGGDGGFAVRRADHRPASAADRRRAAATLATAAGLADWRAGNASAQQRFAQAVQLWTHVPDSRRERLSALQRWAAAARRNNDMTAALDAFEDAGKLARAIADTALEADIANGRAWVLSRLYRYDECLAAAGEALELARASGNETAIAVAYGALAIGYQGHSDFAAAFDSYARAEAAWRRLGQLRSVGVMRYNLGTLLSATSRWSETVDAYRESLALLDPVADRDTVALARSHLALALFELEDPGWRDELMQALAIQRAASDLSVLTRTLDRLASLSGQSGDFAAADRHFEELFEIYRRTDDPLGEAFSRANRAWIELERGRPEAGLADLDRALPVFGRMQNRSGQAYALLARAEAEQQLGKLPAAQESAAAAIDLVEKLRFRITEPLQRMVYLDPRLHFFDIYIEVAMALHAREKAAGHDVDAFEATEQGRARGLLDLLAARHAGGPARHGTPFSPQPLAALARMREPGTNYLVFYCSRRKAYLWSLGSQGMRAFELGPIANIENAVRRVYAALSGRAPLGLEQRQREVAELAALLLPGEALQEGAERLVVVGDGPIRYVPFACLPHPNDRRPLVSRYEIGLLPSLSVLSALRALAPSAASRSHWLAVVADPRFISGSQPLNGAVGRAVRSVGRERLDPLPYTRIEAERLLAMVAPGERLALVGAAARRDWVLRGFLAPYRFVHFATHGFFDPRDVQRSGLALSQIDADGRELEPFLSFGDIEKIRLDADLVVASACDTALGRHLRGEGPVGVSQAFLAAGARRTVGTLWRIGDQHAADFMEILYHGLIVEGLSPAAALRRAQLHFFESDPQLRDPFWSAFVLLGEYS